MLREPVRVGVESRGPDALGSCCTTYAEGDFATIGDED